MDVDDASDKIAGSHPIKEGLMRSLREGKDHFAAAADAVSEGMRHAARGAGRVGVSMKDVIRGAVGSAVHGTLEAGGDLAQTSKGILVGVLQATRETGEAALRTLSESSRSLIRQTARRGGNAVLAAQGLVEGARQGAKAAGLDARQAAASAARAAVEAAEEIGEPTAKAVRAAVAEVIDGVRDDLRATPNP